jgi:hypothetical protein
LSYLPNASKVWGIGGQSFGINLVVEPDTSTPSLYQYNYIRNSSTEMPEVLFPEAAEELLGCSITIIQIGGAYDENYGLVLKLPVGSGNAKFGIGDASYSATQYPMLGDCFHMITFTLMYHPLFYLPGDNNEFALGGPTETYVWQQTFYS